jgi:hypothetical protein
METREAKLKEYRERAGDCWQRAKAEPEERSRMMLEELAANWEQLVTLGAARGAAAKVLTELVLYNENLIACAREQRVPFRKLCGGFRNPLAID